MQWFIEVHQIFIFRNIIFECKSFLFLFLFFIMNLFFFLNLRFFAGILKKTKKTKQFDKWFVLVNRICIFCWNISRILPYANESSSWSEGKHSLIPAGVAWAGYTRCIAWRKSSVSHETCLESSGGWIQLTVRPAWEEGDCLLVPPSSLEWA